MNKHGFHPFHIVDPSPWPLMGSLASSSTIINFYMYLGMNCSFIQFIVSLSSLMMVIFQWWRDIVRESTYQGCHSIMVCNGLYFGVSMFILSEVMFFFSFFFGYFFTALCPDVELGMNWPPLGIQPLDYMGVPILNTVILLSSGISITWAHHSLLSSDLTNCKVGMFITVFLGILFTWFQVEEYFECFFSMADSVYGSLFFISTGFHGIHVIIGTIFILVMMIRVNNLHMSNKHHLGFEAASWYWHFVDVVWLFLFVSIYWWGS